MRLVPMKYRVLVACTPLMVGCAGGAGDTSSAPPVGFVDDCQDRPYFDTLSASDHKTVVKGLSEREREACLRLRGNGGGEMGGM